MSAQQNSSVEKTKHAAPAIRHKATSLEVILKRNNHCDNNTFSKSTCESLVYV
ncbi:hypothetical protein [Stieleria marina]|uniref:hypothetical protein n=1 Tax=Stieleria marina TaxID=1930275 RepID=UPI003AF331E9